MNCVQFLLCALDDICHFQAVSSMSCELLADQVNWVKLTLRTVNSSSCEEGQKY